MITALIVHDKSHKKYDIILLGVNNMNREETTDKMLKSQVAFMLENIFIDFSKCNFDCGERDSQISISFIEKGEKNISYCLFTMMVWDSLNLVTNLYLNMIQ